MARVTAWVTAVGGKVASVAEKVFGKAKCLAKCLKNVLKMFRHNAGPAFHRLPAFERRPNERQRGNGHQHAVRR